MPTATLTSKGQTTIPKEIRDRLGLKPGDQLDFRLHPDGGVVMVARTLRARDLPALLGKPKRRLSDAELDAAIRDGWGTRWRRFRSQRKRK